LIGESPIAMFGNYVPWAARAGGELDLSIQANSRRFSARERIIAFAAGRLFSAVYGFAV